MSKSDRITAPDYSGQNGKGDNPRTLQNAHYRAEHDRIFGARVATPGRKTITKYPRK